MSTDPALAAGELPNVEPQPCRDYQNLNLGVCGADAASRLDSLFLDNTTPLQRFPDRAICEVSNLLRVLGLSSTNPRLYILLRCIEHVDALQSFIDHGATDFWFPFHTRSLPASLDKAVKAAFLQNQWIVLTRTLDLENGAEGEHLYFGPDDIIPFESQGRLGDGTYGTVDKVKSTITGAVYARKRIRRSGSKNMGKNMEMFQKEVLAMKRLQHQHIVTLIGSYTDPVYAAFIISPVADCNLEQYMSAIAVDPTVNRLTTLRTFFGCLAHGLEYMHQQSIRHKDIKPMNILVKSDIVLYTDFGLAFDWVETGKSTTQETLPAMTRAYSAPELLEDAPRNSAADVWSLGCVFAEILTVLRGRSVPELKSFLLEYGSRSTVYAWNSDGLESFLNQLMLGSGLALEEEVFKWIKSMIRKASRQRPTAKLLLKRVEKVPGFMGCCCKAEADGSSAVEEKLRNEVQAMTLADDKASSGSLPEEVTVLSGLGIPRSVDTKDDGLPEEALEPRNAKAAKDFTPEVEPIQELRPHNSEDSTVATLRPGGLLGTTKIGQDKFASGGLVVHPRHYVVPWKSAYAESATTVERTEINLTSIRTTPSRNSLKALLFAAIYKEDIPRIQTALDRGADINSADYMGVTPLIKVARNKKTTVLSFLLRKGADADVQSSDGYTALHVAADVACSDAVGLLIAAGADLNIRDYGQEFGATALFYSVQSRSLQCVTKLLTAGADVNLGAFDGSTPLSWAAANGDAEIVRLLLRAGADSNSMTREMWTPLHFSTKSGHSLVTEMLIEHGADIEAENTKHIRPLHKAAILGHLDCVNILLSAGACVDAKDDRAFSALHKAAASGYTRIVKTLLDHGAPVDTHDLLQDTPLMFAAREGHLEIVKLLCNNGANLNARNDIGVSLLTVASFRAPENVISYLVERGASVDSRTTEGETALHFAAYEGNIGGTKGLLRHGADLTALTADGASPLDFAISAGNISIVELLERFHQDQEHYQ